MTPAANALVVACLSVREAAVILLFHRVNPNADGIYPPLPPNQFEEYCAFLSRSLHVLPLHELVERMDAGKSIKRCCAITFDDGYRDFLTHAYPILEAYGLPVTHFLVADCLATGRPTWNFRIRRIFFHRHGVNPDPSARPEMRRTTDRLNRLLPRDRDVWLAEQESMLPVPSAEPAMLSESDLARFDRTLVSWGSHTWSHGNLSCMDRQAIHRELADSRAWLQDRVGCEIRYLAYPNGMFSDTVMDVARETGYRRAFQVGQYLATHAARLYAVGRFDTFSKPVPWLGLEVSGIIGAARTVRSIGRRPR